MTGMLSAAALLLAKATLLLVAALGVTRALPRAPAGARHLVWLAALAALLLVPAIAPWAPLRIAVLPPVPAASAPSMTAAASDAPIGRAAPASVDAAARAPRTDARSAARGGSAAVPRAVARARRVVRRVMVDPVRPLLALWAAVALVIGGSLARAWFAVRRLVQRARPLDVPEWRDPLWEVADRLGLEEPPRLLRSEDATMPFACGLIRPTIVLPAASDRWTPDRRRAVLLHELAHVRRRDLVGHLLARVVCAVYWFHPLVWAAARRLRAESERACDDVALACGARAADYAEHLLDIVTSVRRDATPVVALAMARRTEFEGRMLDILDAERPRTALSRRQAASLAGVLAVCVVVVGAAAPASAVDGAPRGTVAASPNVFATHAVHADLESRAPSKPTPDRVAGRPSSAVVREPDGAMGTASIPRSPARVVVAPHAAASPRDSGEAGRVALLAGVLRSDPSASLRRTAAWGIAEHATIPVGTAALATALREDHDAAVREMAAWSLASGDPDAAARDALRAAVGRDADPRVRATAAWALGTVEDRGGGDALAGALGDGSPLVRSAAVWALGNVTPREAPRALVAMLRDGDAHVRRLTAWALFTIEDPAATPALQAALRAERDPDLQIADVRALAALGERSVDALRTLLDSPDPRIKEIAVRALAGRDATGPWPWPWPQPRPFP